MSNIEAGEEKQYVNSYGWAAKEPSGILSPFHFSRRANGDKDITMKILYCGICHSDVHFLKNDHGISLFPMVPGHEIVGEVVNVGQGVTKFRVGDIAGVGPTVGSCGLCANCNKGLESYCPKAIFTYSGRYHDGSITQGGYSNNLVVEERFAIIMPKNIQLDRAAPLLCAGITVYSPMKYYGLNQPGLHVGVAGLGGLGHVAVKFGKALGMKVTVISTSPGKREEALERLGADAFLISQDQQQLQDAMGTMDGIIDTVSGNHSVQPLIGLLKTSGKLIMVGAPPLPLEVSAVSLLSGRKIIGGSAAGGTEEMQEMIDFAVKHNVAADVEVIPMDYVNTALERLGNNDVRYRFVIDVANTLNVPAPTN